MVELFCDYEALEFNNKDAVAMKIYPYYLDSKLTDSSLCPICFSASTKKGVIVEFQNVFYKQISFIRFMEKEIEFYKDEKHKELTFWFHNIAYDFRIVLYELFHHGFKQIVDSENIIYTGVYSTQQEHSFAIIGKNLSKFVAVNIYYKGFKIIVRDTMSILNESQDSILKAFDMDSKVDVPWQEININNLRQNMKLIKQRNIYDTTSLAKAITLFRDTFFEKFHGRGTTASSMSMDAYKYYLSERLGIDKKDVFRELYPLITGIDKEITQGCYNGGICTVNKKYAGQEIYNINMIDINSSYPSSMTKALPYGDGEEVYGFMKKGYTEYIVYVDFTMPGIPFQRCHSQNYARHMLGLDLLPKEQCYTRSNFPDSFAGYLCINSIDLDTLKEFAHINKLQFKRGINYKTNYLASDFVIPIYNERKKSTGVVKKAIKLQLNSTYGKFAQDLSGVIFIYDTVDEYTKVVAEDTNYLYKPFACAVTAYSRQNLIRTMYLIGDDFLYCDTDSIYFKNIERCTKIFSDANILDNNELGKWGFDEDYGEYITKGKFLSKKNYILDLHDKIKVTCVGLSKKYHMQVNFDNFVLNSEPFEIYKMVNIYGGKAMRKTKFKIKERSLM